MHENTVIMLFSLKNGLLFLALLPKSSSFSFLLILLRAWNLGAIDTTNINRRRNLGSYEDVPERKGFRDGANLCLGAIDTTNVNRRRGRERETIRKALNSSNIASILKREYVCKGNAWTCDVQNKKHHGLSPIQSYQHTVNLHTSKCMIILL